MDRTLKFALVGALIGVWPSITMGQEASYTCADRHPNGVEVWGCYEGEPYWHIAAFGGDRPMVSGGTLYMPSKAKAEVGMGGRIVENATHNFSWQFEAEANRKVEAEIRRVIEKLF